MMNLALNISLTDEQYEELMSKTHDKIFESEEFVQELSKVILTSIGKYLSDRPGEIKDALGISIPHYSANRQQKENKALMQKVISQAASEYSSEISEAVKITLKNVLKETNIGDIIENVISKAILNAMTSGLTEYLHGIDNSIMVSSQEISELKNRLSLNNY